MDIVAQEKKNSKRYSPHTVSTKEGAVKLYRKTKDIDFVLRRYHISKASLMRWNKAYDSTKESLMPKSHRPHSQHPNAHTEEELNWIRNYHRRNPNISICELYGKLRQEKAYSRHPGSLYRAFVRLGYRRKVESTKKKSKHPGHYDTPAELGKKWKMDVKYVPNACYVGTDGEKFFQYTMIEEASRERFIYAVIENFFGLLKSELLYQQEFQSMEHFKQELVEYLDDYNNRRIKTKLKGLPSALHRQQALSAA